MVNKKEINKNTHEEHKNSNFKKKKLLFKSDKEFHESSQEEEIEKLKVLNKLIIGYTLIY